VFIAAKWEQAFAGLDRKQLEAELNRLAAFLTDSGRRVYLVGDVPEFRFGPVKCKYAHRFGQEHICRQETASAMPGSKGYYSLFSVISERNSAVQVIHPEEFFCDDVYCSMSRDGVILFRDRDHLNVNGSKALWHYIAGSTSIGEDLVRFE
jgi:hypothetical protein